MATTVGEKARVQIDKIKLFGEDVFKKVNELIREGNVRRITIKDKNGATIAEFPLTIGVVGAALAPVVAAIGAIVALVNECTLMIEREER
ncbi:MAG: DUF4342 domain-containing protein [Candidatus Eremiobacteraeota bacterium]|nr:DUF4342 domain-containing protein [Candidatus Eremiobacteraeota bacterium]